MWEECAWERQKKEEKETRRVVVKGVGKGDEGVGLVAKRRGDKESC
jgi:hypothetical protein